jgi:hypothetical protein
MMHPRPPWTTHPLPAQQPHSTGLPQWGSSGCLVGRGVGVQPTCHPCCTSHRGGHPSTQGGVAYQVVSRVRCEHPQGHLPPPSYTTTPLGALKATATPTGPSTAKGAPDPARVVTAENADPKGLEDPSLAANLNAWFPFICNHQVPCQGVGQSKGGCEAQVKGGHQGGAITEASGAGANGGGESARGGEGVGVAGAEGPGALEGVGRGRV